MVDHDRLFKQLLSTFFLEFLQLFAPELADEVDHGSVEFLDKETFTDAVAGHHHIVDLLARVRVRGHPGCVLVHVEPQAREGDAKRFPQRMFRYFAGLAARHPDVPIYPVAVLSQVQLNQLSWREYVRHHNPVAAALMSHMRIEPKDRPHVKLECMRLLRRLRLDPAKTRFLLAFVETYLILDDGERRLFDEELQAMPTDEREDVMGFTNSWIEEGRVEGRAEEREENRRRWATMALSQLHRRVGMIPDALGARVEVLPIEGLERLGVDLLDFSTLADLEGWLDRG